MSKEVVLAGGVRTAIGAFGGGLSTVPAADMGAAVISQSLARAGVAPELVEEVLFGCALQAGLGQNVARQCSVNAGIPVSVPASTINNVCGSGLRSVNMAAAQIKAGDADILVAGGTENMSLAPYALRSARFGYRMNHGEVADLMVGDGLTDAFHGYHMGITAENLAEKYGITRDEQDEFAARSQQKCEAAQAKGIFAGEIIPLEVAARKQTVTIDKDEYPRSGVTAEGLARLRPAFKKDGSVTAGNASGINDGAAAITVMSAQKADELGVVPMGRIISYASAGADPSIMGIAPAESCRLALDKAGLTIGDIDIIEANEAFAAQALAVGRELNWDPDRVNVNGGAIALGHPLGASGCRILVTLLHEMRRRKARYGLATLCVGGGMGVTTVVENIF